MSSVSILIFCVNGLSIIESRYPYGKSPFIIIVLLLISPLRCVSICLIYLGVSLLSAYIWLLHLLMNCLSLNKSFKSILSNISRDTSALSCFPLELDIFFHLLTWSLCVLDKLNIKEPIVTQVLRKWELNCEFRLEVPKSKCTYTSWFCKWGKSGRRS